MGSARRGRRRCPPRCRTPQRGRPHPRRLFAAAALLAAAGAPPALAGEPAPGLTVPLVNYDKRCFYEDLEEGTEVLMHFRVTDGKRNVEAFIQEPPRAADQQGRVLFYTHQDDHDGERRVLMRAAVRGVHKFCLDNAGGTRKSVFFSLRTSADTEKATPESAIERSLQRLDEALQQIQEEQDALRTRERVHGDYVETARRQLSYWSVFEAVALVIAGAVQLRYLRWLFHERDVRNRRAV
eukprot:TRINITY_DN31783_c0_g1_i1.p1 TRINITY_DN31783_c0_g1~~TRINITY_DN31783_c0_g1_i1.p1  ORF type:complete len:239 (+),score=73.58 TRINITY_DN31783_c0_g1_i1:69-785(+)